MHVLMLGGDHKYAFGAISPALSAAEIGTRSASEMNVRVQYYLDNGQPRMDAIAFAKRDYDNDHAAEAAGNSLTSKGTNVFEALSSLLKDIPSDLTNPANWAKFIAAAKGQGYTDSDIQKMKDASTHSSFDVQANMPWLIIGGVALIAVLFMFGTRGRR